MNFLPSKSKDRNIVDGALWVFFAESLLLPTGFIITIFLTRRLGPTTFGLLTLTTVIVTWLQTIIQSLFNRATVKVISQSDNWQSAGTKIVQLNVGVGLAAMCTLWLLASPIATILDDPALARFIRLFAIDIPLFTLARSHRNILIGLGRFRQRALASAIYWTVRLAIIILLVELGLSVNGAILGTIIASLAEVITCRILIQPRLLARSDFPSRQLWSYATPLFVFSLCVILFRRIDLIALKALGGSIAMAGFYGAAQNLNRLAYLLEKSISPLVLSSMNKAIFEGDLNSAKETSRNALRVIILLFPLAALISGSSSEIINLIFGPAYSDAAPILGILFWSSIVLMIVYITVSILTAIEKQNWTIVIILPVLVIATISHWFIIPKFGAAGAAMVTTLVAFLGAIISILVIYKLWNILPPFLSTVFLPYI